MTAQAAGTVRSPGRTAHPAAIVDAAGCGAPTLRAAAQALQGAPVVVIGTLADAERAAALGLRVASSCAPPLGDVARARRPILEALGGPRRFGPIRAYGARAFEAARACGLRVDAVRDPLPPPLAPDEVAAARESWGAGPRDLALLLLAAPPLAGDARLALDIAGRAAMLGGRVVLVVHPGAGAVWHARRFADAARDASLDRLRPVLMTSLCTAFGAIPFLFATGAGAEQREPIGVVVFYGTIVSVLLTLIVVPAVYSLVARRTKPGQYTSRLVDRLLGGSGRPADQGPDQAPGGAAAGPSAAG